MLIFLLNDDILKVRETMHSFFGAETKLIEYNVKNSGKQNASSWYVRRLHY